MLAPHSVPGLPGALLQGSRHGQLEHGEWQLGQSGLVCVPTSRTGFWVRGSRVKHLLALQLVAEGMNQSMFKGLRAGASKQCSRAAAPSSAWVSFANLYLGVNQPWYGPLVVEGSESLKWPFECTMVGGLKAMPQSGVSQKLQLHENLKATQRFLLWARRTFC